MRAIVCMDLHGGIARNGKQLLVIPEDRKWFRDNTVGFTVLMGRTTFDTLGQKPLPGRHNIVITRHPETITVPDVEAMTYEQFWESRFPGGVPPIPEVYQRQKAIGTMDVVCIGGGEIYKLFLDACDHVYVTGFRYSDPHKNRKSEADVFFPDATGQFLESADGPWALKWSTNWKTCMDPMVDYVYQIYCRRDAS